LSRNETEVHESGAAHCSAKAASQRKTRQKKVESSPDGGEGKRCLGDELNRVRLALLVPIENARGDGENQSYQRENYRSLSKVSSETKDGGKGKSKK